MQTIVLNIYIFFRNHSLTNPKVAKPLFTSEGKKGSRDSGIVFEVGGGEAEDGGPDEDGGEDKNKNLNTKQQSLDLPEVGCLPF